MLEQRADLGRVALVVARQLGGEDLAAAGINGEVQLAPTQVAMLAMLFDQPLTCSVNF